MKQTIRIKTNLVFGIVAVLFSVLVMVLIPSQAPQNPLVKEYVNGCFIPYMMSAMMMLCGAISIIKSLVLKQEDIRILELDIEKKNMIFLGIVVVFYLITKYISFLLASVLFSILSLRFFKCKNIKTYAIVLSIVVCVVVIFKYILNVKFGGIWGI